MGTGRAMTVNRSGYSAAARSAMISVCLISGCVADRSELLHSGDEERERAQLRVPVTVINEEQRDAYLDGRHNPPEYSGSFLRADYLREWDGVYDRLRNALEREWEYGIGDGDFFLDGDVAPDRFMCVEVSKEPVLGAQLLATVHDVVSAVEPDYSVDICNSWVFLETEAGENYPDFNIFVEKRRILIYSESEALLKRLGVSVEPSEEK